MKTNYYYLKETDVVQEGDEWSIGGGWYPSSISVGQTYGDYRRLGSGSCYIVRRIITTTPKGNKLCIR